MSLRFTRASLQPSRLDALPFTNSRRGGGYCIPCPTLTAAGVGGGVRVQGGGCPPPCLCKPFNTPLVFTIYTRYTYTSSTIWYTTHMKRYNFFLPEELIETLKVIAQQKDMTHSALIRRILMAYVKQHEQRNA
jgi:hypothetical protein